MPGREKTTTSAQRFPEEATQGDILSMCRPEPVEGSRDGQPVAERFDKERRAVLIKRAILLGIAVIISLIVLYIPYFQRRMWQIQVDIGGLVLGLVCLALARWSVHRGKLDAAGYWMLLTVVIPFSSGELVWANETLYNTIGGVLLIFLVGGIVLPRKWGAWLVTAGLYATYVFLVNQFEPLPRYNIIAETGELFFFDVGLTVLLALAALWQIVRAFRIGTIRARLLVAFVMMALLPSVAIGVAAGIVGVQGMQQRLIGQIELVAMFKEAEVNAWISSLQTDLDDVLDVGTTLLLRTVLQASDITLYGDMCDELRRRFRLHRREAKLSEELFLLDLQGQVVLSTEAAQEGTIHSAQTHFQEGLKGAYVQPPFYSSSLGRTVVFAVRPLADQQGQVLGVLAGCASAAVLNEILGERTGLGETGKAYLVDLNHTLLTESRFGEKEGAYVRTQGTEAAIRDQTNGSAMYEDYRGQPVIGAFHWLPELQVALLAEQDQAEALGGVKVMLGATAGVATAAVLIAVVASLLVSRSIARPLTDLAEIASQIAAGELALTARADQKDEVGALARAFNSMTSQLRGLIGGLEQRVAERTAELERRTVQLRAAADVAQVATSMLNLEQLLDQVVTLIGERFGLYHTSLFLLDETGHWAEYRAGSGEAGRLQLEQGLRLEVGGASMVGWCTAHARPRVTPDVSQDTAYLEHPLLPDTRSEAVLPLVARERVIGALDVQSVEENAFSQEGVATLQIVADQIAVAVDNVRLFAEVQESLAEAQAVHRHYLREAWAGFTAARPSATGYRYAAGDVEPDPDAWLPAMTPAQRQNQVVIAPDDDGATTLSLPIVLRGETIGVLGFKKDGEGEWTDDDVAVAQAVADQVALSLENVRLFDEAQRRARREALTRELTDKMRRTTDAEAILEMAVQGLGRALGSARAFVRLDVPEG